METLVGEPLWVYRVHTPQYTGECSRRAPLHIVPRGMQRSPLVTHLRINTLSAVVMPPKLGSLTYLQAHNIVLTSS